MAGLTESAEDVAARSYLGSGTSAVLVGQQLAAPAVTTTPTAATAATTADPVPATAFSTSPGTAPASPTASEARRAVLDSFKSARAHPHTWTQHGFILLPDVMSALKARVAADRRSVRSTELSIGHYLDAALRLGPKSIDGQIAWAQELLESRDGFTDRGAKSSYRVGPESFEIVSNLKGELDMAKYGRKGLVVVSAIACRFLERLAAEGPLTRP